MAPPSRFFTTAVAGSQRSSAWIWVSGLTTLSSVNCLARFAFVCPTITPRLWAGISKSFFTRVHVITAVWAEHVPSAQERPGDLSGFAKARPSLALTGVAASQKQLSAQITVGILTPCRYRFSYRAELVHLRTKCTKFSSAAAPGGSISWATPKLSTFISSSGICSLASLLRPVNVDWVVKVLIVVQQLSLLPLIDVATWFLLVRSGEISPGMVSRSSVIWMMPFSVGKLLQSGRVLHTHCIELTSSIERPQLTVRGLPYW